MCQHAGLTQRRAHIPLCESCGQANVHMHWLPLTGRAWDSMTDWKQIGGEAAHVWAHHVEGVGVGR